jgi:predicted ABC-type ATPase
MKVWIMRGIPGAGKSTWVANHIRNSESHAPKVVISADRYHMEGDDPANCKYVYRPERAREAHNRCLREFMRYCVPLTSIEIYIDNTNVSAWEIAPYYRIAEVNGFEVEIIQLVVDVETSLNRNIHGVPRDTIINMWARQDELPKWWNRTVFVDGVEVPKS